MANRTTVTSTIFNLLVAHTAKLCIGVTCALTGTFVANFTYGNSHTFTLIQWPMTERAN